MLGGLIAAWILAQLTAKPHTMAGLGLTKSVTILSQRQEGKGGHDCSLEFSRMTYYRKIRALQIAVPARHCGAIAQLGERFHGMEEVVGSIPSGSTKSFRNSCCKRPIGFLALILAKYWNLYRPRTFSLFTMKPTGTNRRTANGQTSIPFQHTNRRQCACAWRGNFGKRGQSR
jgi:hypothetical protein